MPGPNLLIGNGQVLTRSIARDKSGGSKKTFPYTIERARERLEPGLKAIVAATEALPDIAKPYGQATTLITVHPAFLAKTTMPVDIFDRAGLSNVGSKPATVVPEHDARAHAPEGERPTAEIYISGTGAAYRNLLDMLMSPSTGKGLQQQFCKLEAVRFLTASERLLHLDGHDTDIPIEIVLHGEESDRVLLDALDAYAGHCGAIVSRDKLLAVPGLIFMPGRVPRLALEQFAKFSALRAVRRLPTLRLNRPVIRQRMISEVPRFPEEDALDKSLVVAVFDGGLGVKDLSRWSTETVDEALIATHADYLTHGTEVTSALLFGALPSGATELPRPYFEVAHHRVIGHADEVDPDLYECMKRIDRTLRTEDIDFANLSLGPRLAIDDGQPHAWTAMLDGHLADGRLLMTVAAGNDGDIGGDMGRIQPPADAVNALSVGAANSPDFLWDRADYSCHGPGRSPGIIKPDGLAFGGTSDRPLVVLSPLTGGLVGVQGTSFAAPLALRTAAAARALSATALSATALRALMIHKAEKSDAHDTCDVGWGRFPELPEDLLTCEDNEVSVLYQGDLSAGGILRIGLPVPSVPLGTRLRIKATFCFASPVDPADPVNYTRHGLTILFRPRGDGSSESFFSTASYGNEHDLRRDAYKWETVLHRTRVFGADELLDACFDVDHGARQKGLRVDNSTIRALPYVLIATIATEKGEPIYQSVMQKFRALTPIQLRQRVQLRKA